MNLGRPKVLAAKQRVMAINPLVEVDAVQADLAAENAMELLAGCDAAVDCLDKIPARLVLQQAAKQLDCLWCTAPLRAGLGGYA